MEILAKELDQYLENLIPERDDILKDMEEYASNNDFPIVGPQVGQVLLQYTHLTNAERIFELGSGYGYSAIWFARASSDNATIYCTDASEDNEKLAQKYFERAGIENKIEFLVGDAVTQLENTHGTFDIIFCDINKEGYPEAYEASIPRLRQGGLMITDNTLWSGRVVENDDEASESTIGVKKFNQLAFNDDRVRSMILPIRDGVCVSLKL